MGFALVDTSNNAVLSWSRYDEPTPEAGQLVVNADPVDALENLRWDGATGLRAATAQELEDAVDALSANLRANAISELASIHPLPKLIRGLMLIILDEMNAHAAKMNAILTAIDSGSTLAQVKSNIAAIADYPQRTALQLRNAIQSKINAGEADT